MTSVDTNVLVRLLITDDPEQTAAARSLLSSGPIWIAKTVLLETYWVLRRMYKLEDDVIRDAFTKLLGVPNVQTEEHSCVISALALMTHGIEFPDAMHFCSSPPGATFVSFDRSFVRRARRAGHRSVALCGE